MAKTYYVRFGTGDPRSYTGLSPTFLIFNNNGTGVTPPSIAEVTGATGIYSFSFGVTTPICFLIDAATTSPGASGRYVAGAIDPADRSDEYGTSIMVGISNMGTTLVAIGVSLNAIGTSLASIGESIYAGIGIGSSIYAAIGTTASPFGDSATDPSTLFGYLKRVQENLEGDQQFIKATGVLTLLDRTGATTIATQTITNNASLVARS